MSKATWKPSKYKAINPTDACYLVAHAGEQYPVLPSSHDLEALKQDDEVKVAFINKEEIWLVIDKTGDDVAMVTAGLTEEEEEHEHEKLYCRIISCKVNHLRIDGDLLVRNQRVLVERKHVIDIKHCAYSDEGGDDDYY